MSERFTTPEENFPLEEGGEEIHMDDGMEQLPDVVEVESIADVISATGLSPEAIEQYRTTHPAD